MLNLIDRDFFLIAVVLYGLSTIYSIFLWRKGFQKEGFVNYLLLAAGATLHTVAMFKRGFSLDRCPVNNLYEAMLFVAWTIVTSYLMFGLIPRLRFVGAFASPVLLGIGVFALMPALDVHGAKPEFTNGLASLHAALILLAYGAFGLGSVAGLMFLSQEHDLKFDKLRAVLSRLPSIQRLDVVVARSVLAGFALLTVGLSLAPFLLKQKYGVYLKNDPKVMWSLLVWFLYLALLVMRRTGERGGHRFAWGAVGGFAFVLLTFWGFNLLSTVHHP